MEWEMSGKLSKYPNGYHVEYHLWCVYSQRTVLIVTQYLLSWMSLIVFSVYWQKKLFVSADVYRQWSGIILYVCKFFFCLKPTNANISLIESVLMEIFSSRTRMAYFFVYEKLVELWFLMISVYDAISSVQCESNERIKSCFLHVFVVVAVPLFSFSLRFSSLMPIYSVT